MGDDNRIVPPGVTSEGEIYFMLRLARALAAAGIPAYFQPERVLRLLRLPDTGRNRFMIADCQSYRLQVWDAMDDAVTKVMIAGEWDTSSPNDFDFYLDHE